LRDGFFTGVQVAHPTVKGRMIRSFDMTKDGFTLLAMGFTGPIKLSGSSFSGP
jgi:phage regulator Rha-like protein